MAHEKMVKVKTATLSGTALDWVVAKCEGYSFTHDSINTLVEKDGNLTILGHCTTGNNKKCGYSPSTDWAQGGPILEIENISPREERRGLYLAPYFNGVNFVGHQPGPTYLISAMRCYAVEKLGDEVEIPAHLLAPTAVNRQQHVDELSDGSNAENSPSDQPSGG